MPAACSAPAVAASSHGGQAVHVVYVRRMLADGGLGDDDLLWPPARPVHRQAARRAALAGADGPERVFQNCPGKHVGMLCAGGDREVGRMAPLEEVSG